jgi:serine/threonine protein kinase
MSNLPVDNGQTIGSPRMAFFDTDRDHPNAGRPPAGAFTASRIVAKDAAPDRAAETVGKPRRGDATSPHEQIAKSIASKHQANAGNRFQMVDELGRGGWGIVTRAIDHQLDREVAIKKMTPIDVGNEPLRSQFLHEAKITSRLQHPGVVPVHHLETGTDGDAYYVMKLLEGETLASSIRAAHASLAAQRSGAAIRNHHLRRAIGPLLERFIDVCQTVAYAHAKGVIHRDLKPANIMIGRFGETVVLDWGLAVPLDRGIGSAPGVATESAGATDPDRLTRSQPTPDEDLLISGTPAYMAPEQARGASDQVDHLADIYALGATLYEIVVGHNPHTGLPVDQVLERARNSRHDDVRAAQPATPAPLAAIVRASMAASPSDRYATAEALAEDVRNFLSGEAVAVYPESIVDRLLRWCIHHRSITIATTLLVIVLCIASSVCGWVLHRAHQEEQSARIAAESYHHQAVERLVTSRRANDAWLTRFDQVHEFAPALENLNRQICLAAIDQYEQLLAESYDGDQTLTANTAIERLERARCHVRLAELYRKIDRPDRATEAVRNGDEELHQLSAATDLIRGGDPLVGSLTMGESILVEQGKLLLTRMRMVPIKAFTTEATPMLRKLTLVFASRLRQQPDPIREIANLRHSAMIDLGRTIVRLRMETASRTTDDRQRMRHLSAAKEVAVRLASDAGQPTDIRIAGDVLVMLADAHLAGGRGDQADAMYKVIVESLPIWNHDAALSPDIRSVIDAAAIALRRPPAEPIADSVSGN